MILYRGLTVTALFGLVCSCSAGPTAIGTTPGSYGDAAVPHSQSSGTYTVLHSFRDQHDGYRPEAGLIVHGNLMYGTTVKGGMTDGKPPPCRGPFGHKGGCGIVFSITATGTESAVYRFSGSSTNGRYPEAAVISTGGKLYGTTFRGGSSANCDTGCGTVFSLTTSGTQQILHSFGGGSSDGAYPAVALIDRSGTLYGATQSGGASDKGTIFSITTSGTESVLHSFAGAPNDGAQPESALVNVNGTFYGTTQTGGANNLGAVFSITPSGSESVLYSFKGGATDGAAPDDLVAVHGKLYGATLSGGAGTKCAGGCGTLFSLSTTGSERVVHSFKEIEGTKPGGLIAVRGTVYGTAEGGGTPDSGTLFASSLNGTLTVLHNFGGGNDGSEPIGRLLFANGTLFGTTEYGGFDDVGTVYSLKP